MSNRFSLPKVKEEPPKADPDAVRSFAAAAKHRDQAKPWEKHDPEAPPRYNVAVRLNDYHLEVLRFLAKHDDVSQQKVLNRILIPVLEERIEQLSES